MAGKFISISGTADRSVKFNVLNYFVIWGSDSKTHSENLYRALKFQANRDIARMEEKRDRRF